MKNEEIKLNQSVALHLKTGTKTNLEMSILTQHLSFIFPSSSEWTK